MKLLYLMLSLFFVLTTCNREAENLSPTTSTLPQVATSSSIAIVKSKGRWRLVSVLSGWTKQTSVAVQNIELVIDSQLQATYYEEGKEVSRYQYVLTESPWGIRYSIINQVGKTILSLQREGNFRVSDQQLIVGDTGNDGNDYSFKRM